MLKKVFAMSTTVVLAAGLLSGCETKESSASKKKKTKKGYVPKTLNVQFVPSQNADTLEAKAKPLEKLLSDKLNIPVKVSISTNYNTIVEAMASKQVDVGFLPPTAYVLAHEKKAANVILQAQRFGVDDETGAPTKDLVDFYKSEFVVKKDSNINSVKDLKGKKIGYQDVTSSAGYVWPAAVLLKEGVDPLKDVKPVTLKGHVDAAVVFQDARNIVKKDYPNIFDQTKIVKFTEKIPNDTISVRSDLDEEWSKKLQDAFIEIGKNEEGHKIIKEVYSHEGYVKSDDSKFDIVREYGKKVKTQ